MLVCMKRRPLRASCRRPWKACFRVPFRLPHPCRSAPFRQRPCPCLRRPCLRHPGWPHRLPPPPWLCALADTASRPAAAAAITSDIFIGFLLVFRSDLRLRGESNGPKRVAIPFMASAWPR
jgi:hypothetical protein